ncbi:hypothetical protein [Fodinibius sp.]|uniref:hypothetical protein n=1 Tax=Fodinibius sp. TaxID=1872440 RepID=UPI002ACDE5F8|nr:hypothetical protein [Fodinibius sp.]MDZ7659482.1 hypothetical protein [Fodinibius sp.]
MRKKLKKLSENLSYPSVFILLLISLIVSTITQYNYLAYDVLGYTSTSFNYDAISIAYDDGLIWGLLVFLTTGLFPFIAMLIKPTAKVVKRSTIVWYILAILLLLFLWNGSRPMDLNQQSHYQKLENNTDVNSFELASTNKFSSDTLDKKIGITDDGAKTMGSSLAYIYLCERDELIPKDTFGDFMWSMEEILHQNHWEKIKSQYQESLHEKKQYSIAKDRWILFEINQESCNSLEKAIPTLKATMINKWERENDID